MNHRSTLFSLRSLIPLPLIHIPLSSMAGQCLLVPSNRGHYKLQLDGFIYLKESQSNQITYWKCEETYRYEFIGGKKKSIRVCSSRMKTDKISGKHVVIKQPNPHSHSAKPFKGDNLVMREIIKDISVSTHDKPSQILNEVKSAYSPIKHIKMTNDKALKQMIQGES